MSEVIEGPQVMIGDIVLPILPTNSPKKFQPPPTTTIKDETHIALIDRMWSLTSQDKFKYVICCALARHFNQMEI